MAGAGWQARDTDVAAIVAARHGDPFAVFGLHETESGHGLRAFVPHAERLSAISRDGTLVPLTRRDDAGFFEGEAPQSGGSFRFRLRAENAGGTWELDDPYGFGPVLGQMDDHLFVEGRHEQLYDRLGAHARIGLPLAGRWRELMNTDAALYGGSNLGNLGGIVAAPQSSHGQPASAEVLLPPLATLYFEFAGA